VENARILVHIQQTLAERIDSRCEKVLKDESKMREFDNLIGSGDIQA